MLRDRFDEYISRFNAEDTTAFDEFLHPEMRMQNGLLVFHGVQGMKDHYGKIWGRFRESLTVERFTDIKVAYNSFTHTCADGTVRQLGAPTDTGAARLPPDWPESGGGLSQAMVPLTLRNR